MAFKKSIGLFSSGFILGSLLSLTSPFAYYMFFGMLAAKIEAQEKLVANPLLGIVANNLLASFLCAYGSSLLALLFIQIGSEERSLKASLFIFPFSILILNGLVLGVFFGFYLNNSSISEFFKGILPHGICEIPAIIIAGSIGVKIGEKSSEFLKDRRMLREKISTFARAEVRSYFLAVFLFLLAAVLEV